MTPSAPSRDSYPRVGRRAMLRTLAAGAGAFAIPVTVSSCGGSDEGGSGAELRMLTHWNSPDQVPAMKSLLEEFTGEHDDIGVSHQPVGFDQLLQRITADRASGELPDIIHIYTLWLPDFVAGGALDQPPEDVIDDVRTNYTEASARAVSVEDALWGYPTELNTYQVLYNKQHFADAGVDEPPATLDELVDTAGALTIRSGDKTERAGFVALPGWDSGVVHPFTSMLWSSGGEYLSEDGKTALFDSPEGLAVLETYLRMIEDGSIDLTLGQEEFLSGRGSMIVMANFWRNELQSTFADGYENVGVAPIPTGPGGTSTTLQYNWMWAVSATTKNREAAWELVRWLNRAGESSPSPTARYFAENLSAIPSRTADQEMLLPNEYSDPFMEAYIASADSVRAEKPLPGAQEVKTALQQEIEAAWFGRKDPERALADAAEKANNILAGA